MSAQRRVTLFVKTEPVAQPRPRAMIMGKGENARVHVHQVTSIKNKTTGIRKEHPIVAYKQAIKDSWNSLGENDSRPFSGPIKVSVIFVFPRPARMIWKSRSMPRVRKWGGKNDGDNLLKAVWDALNKLAWHDDGQIAEWSGAKMIAAGNDDWPEVVIDIESLGEPVDG